MEEDSPEAKRLKVVTGHEVLAMLRKHENDVIFLSFCFSVFLSRHHSDQMSEGSQLSMVTLCVKIQKWQSVTQSLTKVSYRAARAAKKLLLLHYHNIIIRLSIIATSWCC